MAPSSKSPGRVFVDVTMLESQHDAGHGNPETHTPVYTADSVHEHTRSETTPSSSKTQGPVVEVVLGNLLRQNVDAIVNAWNRNFIPHWLLLTQGVSGAIKREAGLEPFRELRDFGMLPLGAARVTGAGALPFKGIIHVAGINFLWRSSEYSVRESVKNALAAAQNYGFASVAFPTIGAGSSIKLTGAKEIAVWGVSEKQSLEFIQDEAQHSGFNGRVVIVKFEKETAKQSPET